MPSMTKIRVGLCGAQGKMGREVVKALLDQPDLGLVMTVDHHHIGEDSALIAGVSVKSSIIIESDLAQALNNYTPDVVIDFTSPASVKSNALAVLNVGIKSIIGTTGLTQADL